MDLVRDGLAFALVAVLLYVGWARFSAARLVSRHDAAKYVSPMNEYDAADSESPGVAPSPLDGDAYRANHSSRRTSWDPYAGSQSRASRAREQRVRAREQAPRPASRDYYTLLGIERTATGAQIDRAYRKHASVIHPDRFQNEPSLRKEAEAKLRQLNEAAKTLRDPELRRRYDSQLPD